LAILPQMKQRSVARIVIPALGILLGGGAITTEKVISSKIASRVEQQLPNASGISASIPLLDIPSDLNSDEIKAVQINIEEYLLKGSGTKTSLAISAKNISKSKPTQIGSLDITTTIPVFKLLEDSGFNDAEIVDNALQISVGAGGLGKALLVPKYANNQIFLQVKSISFMGSPIPASSLPADIQDQIKSRSVRDLTVPQGLKVKSVSMTSKGLAVNFHGENIRLENLAASL
jgi:hypothetical protein